MMRKVATFDEIDFEKHCELVDLCESYVELYRKTAENFQTHPDLVDRLKVVRREITDLTSDIQEMVVNLDRQRFNLTEVEKRRVEDDEQRDRIMERVKPYLFLSQMIEWVNNPPDGGWEVDYDFPDLKEESLD